MKTKSKQVKRGREAVAPALHKSLQNLASIYGDGITLGLPGDGICNVSLPAGEKRLPLGLIFYDPEKKRFHFSRTPGVDLQEFVSVMRQILPDYGK